MDSNCTLEGSDFGRERELERDRYPPREQTRPDRGYRDRERERNDHYDRREANYPPGDRLDRQRPDRDRQDRQDRGYDRRPERYDDRGGYDVHSGHDRGYRTEGAHRPAPGYSGHSGHSGHSGMFAGALAIQSLQTGDSEGERLPEAIAGCSGFANTFA